MYIAQFNSLFCKYQGFGEEGDGEWGEALGYPPQKPQILHFKLASKSTSKVATFPGFPTIQFSHTSSN